MINKNCNIKDEFMKYIHSLYIGLLSLLFIGCTDEIENSGFGQGEGRLVLSGIKLEAVVGEVTTKAALEEDILPEITDFTIEIVDSEGSPVKTLEPGTLQCSLSIGSYKLKAIYGDAEAMSTTPAFYGETDFTIIEGGVSTPTITASLNQAVLHPIVTEELAAQFKDYKLTIKQTEGETVEMVNDRDFFIPGDGTYTLTLSGKNQLGEDFSHDWQYGNLAVRTRYTVECNPDLPSFTMPEQPEGNVWSKFIYITPMTADNMTSHQDMADKVIDNVVYEASADGITWKPSETKDGKIVITGLEANTKYTLRSRFGAVYSNNEVEVTTESAQQIENGDMESWEEVWIANSYSERDFYDYYIGSQEKHIWNTNNTTTLNGATTHATNNVGTYWRWCAGTVPFDNGTSKVAEISTLAFYTKKITGTDVVFNLWNRSTVYSWVKNSGTSYIGKLYLGTDNYGITHEARPLSLSFEYSYAPVKNDYTDVFIKLYDAQKKEIASGQFTITEEVQSMTSTNINLTYSDYVQKVATIYISFQSGYDLDISKMEQVQGSYNASPYTCDRVVGSVLKIDNVTLNYDYE